jgi:hypothetical protein
VASTTFNTVVGHMKTLSADEPRQLRLLLDSLLAASSALPTEDEFEQTLVAAGWLSVPNPLRLDVKQYQQYEPVLVQGKPVSETLIEDRR